MQFSLPSLPIALVLASGFVLAAPTHPLDPELAIHGIQIHANSVMVRLQAGGCNYLGMSILCRQFLRLQRNHGFTDEDT
jgi:hypothetical protein